jgi:siroheme synthase
MPGADYAGTAASLVGAGIHSTTPCAVVSQASTKDQQIHRTTVSGLTDAPQLPTPTILLVGEVLAAEEIASQRNPVSALPLLREPDLGLPAFEVFADNQVFLR